MVREYYSLMGWDEEGRPTSDTLKRLGLEGALP
jgi:aldehyde:ferredoxin oxidoreductase